MSKPETWYIVKKSDGHCEILPHPPQSTDQSIIEKWGPFVSQAEAIARRVGLIRAGKCQPQ
jgi:hypothetical protein